jgi:glycosyltransferase involved in cell wall biosynthesis
MDQAAARASRQMRVGVDPDYDLIRENFDVLHYLSQARGLLDRPRVDPIEHFLEYGVLHSLSPHPDFSMVNYLERYPERAAGPESTPFLEWLKRGRARGEIADPAPAVPEMARLLGMSTEETLERLVARRRDLRERLRDGELGEMVARAAELEPLVAHARHKFTRARLLPFGDPVAVDQAITIYAAHEQAGFRRARVVLLLDRPPAGGERGLGGFIADAVARTTSADDVVVIYTAEGSHAPPGMFPEGVREVDLAGLVEEMEPEDAEAVLAVMLRTFGADALVNVDSTLFFEAMRDFGKALVVSERVFLCFSRNVEGPDGFADGAGLRFFYRLYDLVAGSITDNDQFGRSLTENYHVPKSQRARLHKLTTPVDHRLPLVPVPSGGAGRRPQVFWVGAWTRQRRVGAFLQVARRMPDVDFRLWCDDMPPALPSELPPNVLYEGGVRPIGDLPLSDADAWLYTSGWDGVPSQLLQVAVTGIPVVGTLVGGVGEVLKPEGAWTVPAESAGEAYVAALRTVLEDPAGARQQAARLRERLLAERGEREFDDQVRELLLSTVPSRRSRSDD